MITNISSIFLAAIHPTQIINGTLVSPSQLTHATWPGSKEIIEIKNFYSQQAQEKRAYLSKILEHQLRREEIKAVQNKSKAENE